MALRPHIMLPPTQLLQEEQGLRHLLISTVPSPCTIPLCPPLAPSFAQEEQGLRHFRAAPFLHPQLKPLAIYHR